MELPITLVAKLAAIVVHADEMLSPTGHDYDRIALLSAITDPEVKNWIVSVREFAPVKRKQESERNGK
jgi:hypothetical protein